MASYQCRGKNKLWSVRFDILENGEKITKRLSGFTKKKDAEAAFMNYMNKYQEMLKLTNPDTNILYCNFKEVFSNYLDYKKDKIKESSYYDFVKLSEKHILPYFENYKIIDVTKPIILQWQSKLTNLGYSYKYKSKIRGILFSFFKFLSLYYDIDNIMQKIENFKKPNIKKEMSIWSLEEFNSFIKEIEDDILYKTFFYFLYYTGCRLGEVLALNYNDFDFKNKTVNICKNVTTKVFNNIYLVTTPKNYSSYRKIILPDILIEVLNTYITATPNIKNHSFFFGDTKPLSDKTIYRKLKMYSNKADIPLIRIHDFRHSHASLLIENGANIVLVSKRLGHANTEQTLNTYTHLFPNSEQELIDKLNQVNLVSNLVRKN